MYFVNTQKSKKTRCKDAVTFGPYFFGPFLLGKKDESLPSPLGHYIPGYSGVKEQNFIKKLPVSWADIILLGSMRSFQRGTTYKSLWVKGMQSYKPSKSQLEVRKKVCCLSQYDHPQVAGQCNHPQNLMDHKSVFLLPIKTYSTHIGRSKPL